MTTAELIREIKIRLDSIDSKSYPDFSESEMLSLINGGAHSFVTLLLNQFEADRIVTADLARLVATTTAASFTQNENLWTFTYPPNFAYFIAATAKLTRTADPYNGQEFTVKLYEATSQHQIGDGFNHAVLRKLPYKQEANGITVTTDYDSELTSVALRYFRQINKVTMSQTLELTEATHLKIVALAVNAAIEGIESQRVQTNEKELTKNL